LDLAELAERVREFGKEELITSEVRPIKRRRDTAEEDDAQTKLNF
jgi:hypothetical protein